MATPPFDLERAHHWFAVECNNQSWELVEASARTAAQVEQMIHAAHAACLHWLAVGTPLNHLRAQCLLATAYTVAGHAAPARHYAEATLRAVEQLVGEATAFDRATAHGCARQAYALNGAAAQAERHRTQMLSVVESMTDHEERDLVLKLYGR